MGIQLVGLLWVMIYSLFQDFQERQQGNQTIK